jgi:hypothetical protein
MVKQRCRIRAVVIVRADRKNVVGLATQERVVEQPVTVLDAVADGVTLFESFWALIGRCVIENRVAAAKAGLAVFPKGSHAKPTRGARLL